MNPARASARCLLSISAWAGLAGCAAAPALVPAAAATAPVEAAPGAPAHPPQPAAPGAAAVAPATAPAGATAAAPGVVTAPAPAPQLVSAGASNGGSSSGGSSSGGSASPPVAFGHLTLPGGQVVNVPVGEAIELPLGTMGEVTLDVPGRVPSSLLAPGGALTVHPQATTVAGVSYSQARLTGDVTPPEAGLTVQFLAPGRHDFQGGVTDGLGHFDFTVSVVGPTAGLLVAKEALDSPQLGLARVTADPATPANVPVTLVAPIQLAVAHTDPAPGPYRLTGLTSQGLAVPAPGAGLSYEAAVTMVVEGSGAAAWAASLLSNASLATPTYDLPAFRFATLLRAASADHQQVTTVLGAPGAWPSALAPPDLAAVASPAGGRRLTWPVVPGASLYVARLYAPDVPDTPLWEGATTTPSLPLPPGLALAAGCTLQVDAWDAPGVTIYTVASFARRSLRMPAQSPGLTGRHSWATRAYPAVL